MKLRIHNNSIRLRLSQKEVDQIGKGEKIEEKLTIPGSKDALVYALIPSNIQPGIQSSFSSNQLEIYIPEATAKNWANSELVSLYNSEEPLSGPGSILIEKDFQCLHKRPNEDESGNFPNPLASEKK